MKTKRKMKNLTKINQQTQNKAEIPDYISKKNYHMTCFICLAIVLQGCLLAVISLIDSNFKVVISTFAYTLLMLATLIYTRHTKNLISFMYLLQ